MFSCSSNAEINLPQNLKLSVFKTINIDIYLILDQTKLLKAPLWNGYCHQSTERHFKLREDPLLAFISGVLGGEVDCDFFIVENHSVTLNSSAECPEVPPKLVGRLKVVVDIRSEEEIGTADLEPGGEYIPRCTPR